MRNKLSILFVAILAVALSCFAPTFDPYGGRMDIVCATQGLAHWHIETIGGYKYFCTPVITSPTGDQVANATSHGMILQDVSVNQTPVNPTFDCARTSAGTATAASQSAGTATYTFSSALPSNAVVGNSLTTTGFSPSGWNVTDQQITAINTGSKTISIAMSNSPGAVTTFGTGAIDVNVYPNYATKYGTTGDTTGTTFNWGWQELKRFTAIGWNATGLASGGQVFPWNTCSGCTWPGSVQPVKVPTVIEIHTTLYAAENRFGFQPQPAKDLVFGTNGAWGNSISAAGVADVDVFDPNEATEINTEMLNLGGDAFWNAILTNDPWVAGFLSDDSDSFVGLGSGPDFGGVGETSNKAYLTLITSPVQTAGGQTSNSPGNFLYPDSLVYQKAQATNPAHGTCTPTNQCSLHDFLYDEYSGSLSALNTAWGSNYTTWGSSGSCVGLSLWLCNTTTGIETVTLSSGSYTLAHSGDDPFSVALYLLPSGGSAVQVTGDLPWGRSGGSVNTGQFNAPTDYGNFTGWREAQSSAPAFYYLNHIIVDTNGCIEQVSAVSNGGKNYGNTGTTQPTWTAGTACTPGTNVTDNQLTWTARGPELTGTINYSTGVITVTIGGNGTLPAGEVIQVSYMYHGWGQSGTGLMDENGLLSHSWVGTNSFCLEGANPSYSTYFTCNGTIKPVPNANATFGADLDNWIVEAMAKYARQFHDGLRNAGSNVLYFGIDSLSGWGGVPYSKIMQGESQYSDTLFMSMLWDGPTTNNSPTTTKSMQLDSAFQYVTQYTNDKPLSLWMAVAASADSDQSCHGFTPTVAEYLTQGDRGTSFFNMVNYALTTKGVNNDYPFVEVNNLGTIDFQGEDWGQTSIWDNAYDYNGTTGEAQTAVTNCDSSYTVNTGVKCGSDNGNYGDYVDHVHSALQVWLARPASGTTATPAPTKKGMFGSVRLIDPAWMAAHTRYEGTER